MNRSKKLRFLVAAAFAAVFSFIGCTATVELQEDPPNQNLKPSDAVNWNGDNNGTLELINGSNKDMVLFIGQSPSQASILGGVRAGATKTYDVSKHVDDFSVGGYTVVRGVARDQYDEFANDPSKAKQEFTAMVTYKSGTKYRYNIDPNYMGDNAFRVGNRGRIGMELRKDSPNGEKIAYLPALAQNQLVYADNTNAITLFPVYVFFNRQTSEVSTINAADIFQSVQASPRPATGTLNTYFFPHDETLSWESIVGSLKHPAAYITILNNVPNQGAYVMQGTRRLVAQSGYDDVAGGETAVYEVVSTDAGLQIDLRAVLFGGAIQVPIRFADDMEQPLIENGFDYSVSITYNNLSGNGMSDVSNYKANLVKNEKRDLSDQLVSL